VSQNPLARKADDDELPDSGCRLDKISSSSIKSCFSFVKRSARSRKRQRAAANNRSQKIAIEVANSTQTMPGPYVQAT
jgi:hypothetical protein